MHISGGNAFTIDLWGDASDPYLQALHFFATVGCTLCVQIAKPFLAERVHQSEAYLVGVNCTQEETMSNTPDHTTPVCLNTTKIPNKFESDVQNVFFIVGAFCVFGTLMLLVSWVFSGCKWSHTPQTTIEDAQKQSVQSSTSPRRSKCYMLMTLFLLCIVSFLGYGNEETFAAFGITFTVNSFDWSTSDASNLVTVFWASVLVCRCVSIVFAKFIKVNKFLIGCTLIGLVGTALMTSLFSVSPISLWIGASLLGLGNGNTVANALNAAKRLSGQTGVISSVIFTSAYTGRIIAPQIVGYLIDNVDPMWFLYLGVVYSGCMFVLSVVFQMAQVSCQNVVTVEQGCDVPLAKIETPDT